MSKMKPQNPDTFVVTYKLLGIISIYLIKSYYIVQYEMTI